MGWFSRKVLVALVDDATGSICNDANAGRDLPESFEMEPASEWR